jgi:hypothetical protein
MFNLDSLRKQLTTLTDEALLEVVPEDLTEEAKAVYDAELAARNLSWPGAEEEVEVPAATSLLDRPDDSQLVLIARYETFAEARYAYMLLKQEEIPVWLAGIGAKGANIIDPNAPLDLVTLPEHLETAQMLLSSEISDEELAMLAEQAGDPEREQ